MKLELVSIIIPAYNAAVYIREAVDSALAQTYPNCEVIVVDDGSTDNTRVILEPYINARKIQYIYQPNKGLSGARNTGIRAAKGEYIALLDADDLFLPTKIERQIKYLTENPSCDVSYSDLYHFWDEEPNKLLKLNYKYYSGEEVLSHLLWNHFIAPLTVVLRRSVFNRFGYFEENLRRSEDLDFWLRLAYGGAEICFLPEILAKLRMRKTTNLQGLESQPQVKLTGLQVVERLNDRMTAGDKEKYQMSEVIKFYRQKVAFAYILTGNKQEAKKYASPALRMALMLIPIVLLRALAVRMYFQKRAKNYQAI